MKDSKLTFGLIGKKLEHSFSRKYFTEKFEKQQLPYQYVNFEIDSVDQIRTSILTSNRVAGLNVTIPYKEAVINVLDELAPSAKDVGAVNTIEIKGNQLIGHNTDVFGFRQLIKPYFKGHHERALILGTGGASKAVIHVLENLGVSCLLASRNPRADQIGYSDINEHVMRSHLMIVNCTPLGMYPNVALCPELPYQFIEKQHLAVDLIYNPAETKFMQHFSSAGANAINGLTMLHQQAEGAWNIWQNTSI